MLQVRKFLTVKFGLTSQRENHKTGDSSTKLA